jgi:alkylation response protein AidB-like acyl-CoA dehydrogenase
MPLRRAEFVLTKGAGIGHLPAETARTSLRFTICEGTSEIQRLIIGGAVTGLTVR